MKTKKVLKITAIVLGVFLLIVVLNGVYYLFHHQYKTVEKIDNKQETNLYEKASILTLHTGLWTLGHLYCHDAACANFKMLTADTDTVYLHSKRWLSPMVMERFAQKKYGRMAWNGNEVYDLSSPENNAAILLNYCDLAVREIGGKCCYTAACPYTWEVPSKTSLKIGPITIVIHEQLFYELQRCGILHPFTLVAYYEM